MELTSLSLLQLLGEGGWGRVESESGAGSERDKLERKWQ